MKNKNDKLTNRQKEILKKIIDEYVNTAIPVSSQVLVNKYFNNLSTATIRNEMNILEKNALITKSFSSSGRTPSLAGYKIYSSDLSSELIPENFKNQIRDLLASRNLSIDEIIEKSVEIISNSIDLPSVITKTYQNDLLKKIDLVQIDEHQALIILVTSSGNILKKEIYIDKISNIDDVVICVNVFNDRLVDTPISNIEDKLDILKNIIKAKVKSYEFVIHEVIEKVFDNIDWTKIHVNSSKNMLIHPEFNDLEKLQQLLILLRDVSIWKQIAYNRQSTGKTAISFNDDLGISDVSIASANIQIRNSSSEIAIIGPARVTHAKAKALLEFLKKEIERNYH